MKSSLRLALPLVAFLIALLTAAGITLWAADSKSAGKGKAGKSNKTAVAAPSAEDRPPLKISVDRKPIDRNAYDRVSYAPVIKRTASSVVYVYSSKKVKATDMYPFL